MPSFLTKAQISRILQRELPEFLYPDGAESDYVSTAEVGSIAQCLSSVYSTMESIYNNHFPLTTNEKIGDWETTVFGKTQSGDLTLEERKGQVLAFLRAENNISFFTVLKAIIALVPEGIVVEIRPRTFVGDPITADLKGDLADEVWGPDWQSGDPAPSDVTVTDAIRNDYASLLIVRTQAYRYACIIWGGSISAELQAVIEKTLLTIEPARCKHDLIFAIPELPTGTIEIDEFNAEVYKSAYADPTSNTGYRATEGGVYFGFDGDAYALGFGDALQGSEPTDPGGYWYFLVTAA
jgi:hypothetical protein